MSIANNLANVFTRIGTEFKAIRSLINGGGSNLTGLTTVNKANLVAAINEVNAALANSGAQIDDSTISLLKVWSSDKTNSVINQKVADLVGGSPDLLNSLKELADAIGDDPNFAASIATQLGAKADKNNAVFTGTHTVPDGSFTIAKTTGLQLALDNKITAFADPNADRILFWDDSAGIFDALGLSGLQIAGTTLSVIPSSDTVAGAVELATLAEVATGTDTVRAVTPAGVAQQIATRAATTHTHTSSQITDFASAVDGRIPATSTTQAGIVELATLAEVATGTDAVRAVTPAGVAQQIATRAATTHSHTSSQITDFNSSVDARIPATSSTQAGIVELATDTEAATGTDTARAITPANLRAVTGDPETNWVTVFETALV
jgi:hypothetical protein